MVRWTPASTEGLEVVEILPNHKDCSPLGTSLECGDYVKLYNSSNHDINLANYRLRIGYKGQNPSISNTFTWGQNLDPANDELDLSAGQYFTLTTRDDGSLLSVPDDGDFVWLEDAYGQKVYSPVVEYPSAASTTKVGYSWAFDGASWQWTSMPSPEGSNYFYLPPSTSTTSSGNELKPCRSDQFRNPLTNRCKKKDSASSSLKPCRSDQFRNPVTNRCKSKASVSSSLKPCKPNQFRNPATNRCKSKASVGSSLKPCKPGQKRNPLTNRCRKVGQVAGAAVQKIQDVPQKTGVSWWVAGAAGASAVGYGVYEWRSEIITLSQRLLQLPKSGQVSYTKVMRILGIDPGTGILGFGVIDHEKGKSKLIDAGVIRTPVKEDDAVRLKTIYEELTEIIKTTRPKAMSVEKLFFAKNVTTAMTVAQARGIVLLCGQQAGLDIYEYTPLQIKQALTGYGQATKQQIQEMVRLSLGLKDVPKPDDCADAIAAAIMHAQTVQ